MGLRKALSFHRTVLFVRENFRKWKKWASCDDSCRNAQYICLNKAEEHFGVSVCPAG